jgi:hypothetical protein
MPYENKPREGALFKNKEKTAETDPDYKGSYKHADGTEDGLNVWINTSKSGDKYMKISGWSRSEAAAKGVQQAKQALAPQPEPQPQGFPEDDIPF